MLLTINAGSSSLKLALFADTDDGAAALRGQVDGFGGSPRFRLKDRGGKTLVDRTWSAGSGPRSTEDALNVLIDWLSEHRLLGQVAAVGHRIVHGGTRFATPVRLDSTTLSLLETLHPLAPLHQPHNLAGVRAALAAFPDAAQVGCFDTAFHQGHDWVEQTFALPPALFEEGVRRYGFHGLSYEYVGEALRAIDPTLATGRVIVAHLGSGASVCAIKNGRSIATSMGFSALDGLPMSTRCGQIDPGVLLYLMSRHGYTAKSLSDLLYNDAGLKALSGLSGDMRVLEAAGSPRADAAIAYFCHRIRREIGALAAVLEGVDGLVFTGGIGENSARVRTEVCGGLGWLGVSIDPVSNGAGAPVVSTTASPVRVRVIATDEEAMIARHTRALLSSGAAA